MGKSFSWSFSRLKNYETCPKRHYEIDIQKNFIEPVEPGGPLDWGNRVHASLAAACSGSGPLPAEMVSYQKWVDRVKAGPGKLLVEQKYAITKEFQPCSWFAPVAWYRGIGDVVRLAPPVALILDWKTGKVLVDSVQLMLMAQCVFAHFPEIQKVRSEYVWLKDDCTSPEIYSRQDVADTWVGLLERVKLMEAASKRLDYPPKPSGLCKKYCPVKSCPYWGKGAW